MGVTTGRLSRYFGQRFLGTVLGVFGGILLLIVLVDFIEMTRRTDGLEGASAYVIAKITLFRAPHITEQILPFSVLIAAMSCYLGLSRRLEVVVARAAGMSAWQFIAPAAIAALALGILATTIYNPVSAILHDRAKRLEESLFRSGAASYYEANRSFWVRQRGENGQSIIHAKSSRSQGIGLSGVAVFTFDNDGRFLERIEARNATLIPGQWRLEDARIFGIGVPPREQATYLLSTTLTPEQVRESFSTPETVPFWQLPAYIETAEQSGLGSAGYRFQYYKLIALPFLLAAMVFLAASVSLRLFRFGGVQKMVLSGIAAGFLLYVLSKVTEDLSRAGLLYPLVAAWLPVMAGGLTGFVSLLYQEDG